MFTFCIQKDTIRVQPCDFGKDPVAAIREEIHRRYANKILPGVGLCISLLDILETSEGAVLYGDGCYYYKTEFRLIVFRPFIGEAFVGKVKSQTEAGITVTIGFFDDITVPAKYLATGTAFDPNRQAWFWIPDVEDPAPSAEELLASDSEKLYIEKKDWVRVRTEAEYWDDSSPINGRIPAGGGDGIGGVPGELVPRRAPYSLHASMADPGLGVLDWWEESIDDDGEGME